MKTVKIFFGLMIMIVFSCGSCACAQENTKAALISHEWEWVNIAYSNGDVLTPDQPKVFSIFFNKNGNVYCLTDCNSFNAEYLVVNNKLEFGGFTGTKMFCINSQEFLFMNAVRHVIGYEIDKNGQLVLIMDNGAGAVIFKAQ